MEYDCTVHRKSHSLGHLLIHSVPQLDILPHQVPRLLEVFDKLNRCVFGEEPDYLGLTIVREPSDLGHGGQGDRAGTRLLLHVLYNTYT